MRKRSLYNALTGPYRLFNKLKAGASVPAPPATFASMVAAGLMSLYIDPSDMSTLFQDSAGATPVTAVGQQVGRVLDKSGKGNHLIQATAGSRPYYAVMPKVGIRNLNLNTGWTGAATGTPGTAPTGWLVQLSTGSISAIADAPAGFTGKKLTFTCSGTRISVAQNVTVVAGTTTTFSFYMDAHTIWAPRDVVTHAGPTNSGVVYKVNGVTQVATTTMPAGNNYLVEYIITWTASGVNSVRVGMGNAGGVTQSCTIWAPQTELGTARSATQYVSTTGHEVTEAGQTPCYYLKFDGTDDFLVSAATVNFSATDKLSVFAAVRKFVDTGAQIICSTGAGLDTVAGTFELQTSSIVADASRRTYAMGLSGFSTSVTSPNGAAGIYAAPHSATLVALYDYAGTTQAEEEKLRVNGSDVALTFNNTNTCSGTFGNQLLYVGRRAGTSLAFNGNVFGLGIMPTIANSTEIGLLEAEMNLKLAA